MIVSGFEARGYIDMDWVVFITPLKSSFFAGIKGYVDVGFDYTKANKDATLTLKSRFNYRTVKYLTTLNVSSYFNQRTDQAKVTRNSYGIDFNRFLPARFFARINANFEQNSELNLDLRILLGGGAGRYLVQTNNKLFSAFLGLTANMEYFAGAEKRKDDLEGVMSAAYEWFRFDTPKLDFQTSLYAFPALSGGRRWRLDFDARLSYEIFKDFTIGISVFDNYDSRSPSTGSWTNDWGLTTSLGLTL
jgi:hypothetical protein